MLKQPKSVARRTADVLLLGMIAAQPALDSLTYWLMSTGRANWAAYLRAAALGLFGALALLEDNSVSRWLLSGVWALFVLSKYPLANMLLPGSGFTETANMFRTMIAPMFALWLLWHVQADPVRGARTITTGLLWSAVVLAALAALSLVTGTYNITYHYQLLENTPEVQIGFSAWNYSSNAQSIVLAVLLALGAPVLARWRRPWALLTLLGAFGLMMYFQGTRTAYYAMLVVGVALLAALVVQLLRRPKPRWWALAAAVVFLALGFALKPLSPLAVVDQSRDKIRDIANFLQNESGLSPQPGTLPPAPEPTSSAAATAAPEPTPAPAETPTAEASAQPTAEPAASPSPEATNHPPTAPWDVEFRDQASMFYFTQESRNGLYALQEHSHFDSGRIDAAAYEYMKARMALPPEKLVDMRKSHLLYVAATLRHADALRLLTGYGVTWYTDVLGSVENDYAALIGYFGIVGCAVFFGIMAWVLLATFKKVRWRNLRKYLTLNILMDAVTFLMLLGLAAYSGRVFQQGSVSFYLSLLLALTYCHACMAGDREADDER